MCLKPMKLFSLEIKVLLHFLFGLVWFLIFLTFSLVKYYCNKEANIMDIKIIIFVCLHLGISMGSCFILLGLILQWTRNPARGSGNAPSY